MTDNIVDTNEDTEIIDTDTLKIHEEHENIQEPVENVQLINSNNIHSKNIKQFIVNNLNNFNIIDIDEQINIINIYDICRLKVKEAFDGDSTNNIDSWDFSDWIKIILPIVKAIEKHNNSQNKGEYKKNAAIVITMCVIHYDLDISKENKNILLHAVNSYLKPSIDTIVYLINSMDTKLKCFSCF